VLCCVLEKRIQQDIGFGPPPPVNRLFADTGFRGDAFNGDGSEPKFDQQVIGRFQNRLARLLAPAVAVAGMRWTLCARGSHPRSSFDLLQIQNPY
jgi:hypothetical protein